MTTELQFVNVEDIRINSESLRTVDQKNPRYVELVQSVKQEGILLPINIAPAIDPETKLPFYTLVDGLQRLTAAKSAGLEKIPAIIMEATDLERLKRQVITNSIQVDTSPADYAKQLMRILQADPLMTKASLAASLGKSEAWLSNILKLNDLTPEAASLVDEGAINVTSATYLAKLPPDLQKDYLESAQTLPHTEFQSLVAAKNKELAAARRAGREAGGVQFEAVAHLQKIGDIKTEIESLANANNIIGKAGLRTAEEGFKAALQWVLHLDEFSVAAAKQKHEDIQATRKNQSDAAKMEREKKKVAAAELKAARSKVALEAMERGENPDEALKKFDAEHATKTETEAGKTE